MKDYDSLNEMQKKSVEITEGPVLVLAGAGSGKTRALTHRIAYLIEKCGVKPQNIMALTFTNKAADEMRERVNDMVDCMAGAVWVSTFHSTCVRILRRHIDILGYGKDFTIYDGDDQKTLIRRVLKKLDYDPHEYRDRSVLAVISGCKDELISAEDFSSMSAGDFRQSRIADAYLEYQAELKKNNALDFDDLIAKTVELFKAAPEVLNAYEERFRYIMVDEYQDTNTAQFKLIELLSSKYKNLFVVGDDDQSIYKFRGANIKNILEFETAFPGAAVVRLEQNYRSTGNILGAANSVIRHNEGRKDKTLWTENGAGDPVIFRQYDTACEEADAIASGIASDVTDKGERYSDFAVLYRTNAQSRLLEEKFIDRNVPYRLVGGVNFYQRREIKDILSYLKTVDGGRDDLSVQRIINVPKRGIGAVSIGKLEAFASGNGMSFYEACLAASRVPTLGNAAAKVEKFTDKIRMLRSKAEHCSIAELIDEIVESTGYREELEDEDDTEAEARLENIEELKNKAISYAEDTGDEEQTLSGFLAEVALVADVDSLDDDENRVTLMTLHAAKGLEFDNVYMAGMEEGLFPGMMAIADDTGEEIEEERRLCYVGITRAKRHLTMTAARSRMVNGETRRAIISRFIDEIPPEYLKRDTAPSMYSFGSPYAKGHGAGGKDGRRPQDTAPAGGSWRAPAAGYGGGDDPVKTYGRQFTVTKADRPDYKAGDRVRHSKFGDGTVADVTEEKRDFAVTVDFDKAGRRRMYATFAKLEKL